MNFRKTISKLILSVFAFFALVACGGGNNGSSSNDNRAAPAGVSSSSGTLTTYKKPTKVSGTGKRLLAVYMVGSDLESQSNAGTADLNEMITGYNSLSTTEKSSLDVVVAFGGANKSGWKGMKIATMSQIISDGSDGAYGDETSTSAYQYKADLAHMGDKSSLKLFLTYLKDGYPDHEIQFFVFWDHGSTYTGFGNDEVYNSDPLYLNEINSAFKDSGVQKFDLIGFDACLQASIETSRYMTKYGDYLLASEELEPGHGWLWSTVISKYTTIDFGINSDPATTIKTLGKALCDNYVLDVHEYQSTGKTLSLSDMSKFTNLETKLKSVLDEYTKNMSTKEYQQGVLYATTRAQAFGKNEKGDSKNAVDIKDFAMKLKEKTTSSTVKTKINELMAAIDTYVIYARNDGTNPSSNGVAICPPEDTFETSLDGDKVNQNFLNFQKAYKNKKSQDVTAPAVVSSSTNTSANASSYNFTSTTDKISAALKGKKVILKYKTGSSTNKFYALFSDESKVKAYWSSVGDTSAGAGKWQISGTDVNLTLTNTIVILDINTSTITTGIDVSLYEYPKGTTEATAKLMVIESMEDLANPSVVSDAGSTTTTSDVASTTITFTSGDSVVLKSDETATGNFADHVFTNGAYVLYSDGLAIYFDNKDSAFIQISGSLQAGTDILYYTFNAKGLITSNDIEDTISSVVTTGTGTKKSKEAISSAPFLSGERAAFVSLKDPKKGKLEDNVTGTVTSFTEDNLKSVTTIYGFFLPVEGETDRYFMSIAEVEAYQTETENEFFTPKWNKNWYTVKYSSDDTLLTQWMPMIFAERIISNGKEYVKYNAEIDFYDSEKTYTGETQYDFAVLEILVNENNEIVEHQVTPYQILYEDEDDTEGRVQYSKIKKQIKAGDKVQFFNYGYNIDDASKDGWFEASDVITFEITPEFNVELLEFEDETGTLLEYSYSLFAEDINGNGLLTDPAIAE